MHVRALQRVQTSWTEMAPGKTGKLEPQKIIYDLYPGEEYELPDGLGQMLVTSGQVEAA